MEDDDNGELNVCSFLVRGAASTAVARRPRGSYESLHEGTAKSLLEKVSIAVCGACKCMDRSRRLNSCLTLAMMHDRERITTIAGVGTLEKLVPMQVAFIEH